jgi:hypothetical protein
MDERARQQLEVTLRYHVEQVIHDRPRLLNQAVEPFARAHLYGLGRYRAVVDAMGAVAEKFAKESLPSVLNISRSHHAFSVWEKFIQETKDRSFADWESVLEPRSLRLQGLSSASRIALQNNIDEWSARIERFVEMSRFEFTENLVEPDLALELHAFPIAGKSARRRDGIYPSHTLISSPADTMKSKGGRPQTKSHDEVAETVSAQLSSFSDHDFRRLTGESVKEMMSAAHIERGETAYVDIKAARILLSKLRTLRAG